MQTVMHGTNTDRNGEDVCWPGITNRMGNIWIKSDSTIYFEHCYPNALFNWNYRIKVMTHKL